MITPFEYHRETKHSFEKYARSPGQMEWETQPDPFRRFAGAKNIELPLLDQDPTATAERLFSGSDRPAAVTVDSIAGLLELSLGLSCWKEVPGSRWALRMNPSSGNLHPTEAYLVLPELEEIAAGVYHYAPRTHSLEQRIPLPRVAAGAGFFLGLTAIFWRESWKYGERAFRYCNHDAGHAAAAVRFAASLYGWNARICEVGDESMETLLGLNRTEWHPEEAEHPDMLLWVGTGEPVAEPEALLFQTAGSKIPEGIPNRLSSGHRVWNRIDEVAKATRRSGSLTPAVWATSPLARSPHDRFGAAIIRQRRSAVAMDRSQSRFTREQFKALLTALLPRADAAPFDLGLGTPRVHPVFFVHRADGFAPGLYIQVRNEQHRDELGRALEDSFIWEEADGETGLYLLAQGTFRREAAGLSCGQAICGNGAFAVAMLGRFSNELQGDPGRYRELFWEAGMLGQVLYLQAEMSGKRGTGIGCYFDDPVHQMLGITDESYQSIYHFTVGAPVDDERISTREPYFHLSESRTRR